MFSANSHDFENGDIAAMLAEEASARVFSALLDTLADGRGKVNRILDQGVAPDEFAIGQKIVAAYDAAIDGVGKLRAEAESR